MRLLTDKLTVNCHAPRAGTALIYLTVTLVGLVGFASLAVDFGHVQVVKTQLRRAADAAALYGSIGARTSSNLAVAWAQAAAGDNAVDGTPLSLSSSDVTVGTAYSGGGFVTGGVSPNAVRVMATRSSARGTAVSLTFARVFGQATCDVNAASIARWDYVPPGGFVGYQGVTAKNNTFFGSYNSAVNTSPTEATSGSNCILGSNAVIYGKNNNTLQGNALLGPSATITGFSISGSSTPQTNAIPFPSMPAYEPGTNPNNTPEAFTTSGTTLPGGLYYFSSMTVNGNLYFSGPATLIVDGNITFGGNVWASNNIPANLRIYQLGASTFGDAASNGMDLIADVWAPQSDFTAKNNLTYRGRGFFNTITCKNNADFFYDQVFQNSTSGNVVTLSQ